MKPIANQSLESFDSRQREKRSSGERAKHPTDMKIQALFVHFPVLIEGGSLLASAVSPRIVIGFSLKKEAHTLLPRKKEIAKKHPPSCSSQPMNKYFPIGLHSCEQYSWINAFMQFVLFVPLLREIFMYTPKSLSACNEFIDRYFLDLEAKALVSKADGFQVVRSLLGKFPMLAKGMGPLVNLHEIIQYLFQSAWDASFSRPEWQLRWDGRETGLVMDLQRKFEKKNFPFEMLVGLSSLYEPSLRGEAVCKKSLERHYAFPEGIYFDLDAFIEYRPDGITGQPGSYFTYLKVDGFWVQCSDHRITLLRRATFLEVPLCRGILFHYRRVATHYQ
jgi:hypothetical protein